jgi:hypothetical protein
MSINIETYRLSLIDTRRPNKDVMSTDPVNTILSLVLMESIVVIPQDLLDLGSGPDHIGFDQLGRKRRFGSLQQ